MLRAQERTLPFQLEPRSIFPRLETAHLVLLVVPDDKLALHSARKISRPQAFDPAVASRITNSRQAESALGRNGGRSEVGDPTGPVDHERLSEIVEGDAPRIARPHEVIEERIEPQFIRPEAIDSGLEKRGDPEGGFHPGLDPVPLAPPELSPRTPHEGIARLVRVPIPEAGQDHRALVRHAVTIGVTEGQQLRTLPDIHPVRPHFHPGRDQQSFCEHPGLIRPAIVVGIPQRDHPVVTTHPRLDLRIDVRAGHVHPAAGIPAQGKRIAHPVRLIGKEIHLEPLQDLEGSQLICHIGLL